MKRLLWLAALALGASIASASPPPPPPRKLSFAMTFAEGGLLRRREGDRTDRAVNFGIAAGASLRLDATWRATMLLGLNYFGAQAITRMHAQPFGSVVRPFVGLRYVLLPVNVCDNDISNCPLEEASDDAVSGGSGHGPAAEVGASFVIGLGQQRKNTLLISASYMQALLMQGSSDDTETPLEGTYDGFAISIGISGR